MINRINYTTPQYQQRPAFKGEKEVKMLVGLTTDLSKRTSGNLSTLGSRLNEAVKKVSQDDLKEAAKKVQDWQAIAFKMFIKDN